MKRLICIYDSKLANDGTYSFMKVIQKGIKDVEFLDVNNPNVDWEWYHDYSLAEIIEVLSLRPIQDKYEDRTINYLLRRNLENEGLPLVAEAILRVLGDVKGKSVVVLNQSMNIGIPLVAELMRKKATVLSVARGNSIKMMEGNIENFSHSDVLITATGNENYKFMEELEYSEFTTDLIIDLSNDVDEDFRKAKKIIRNVNIVEVLKERLKWNLKLF